MRHVSIEPVRGEPNESGRGRRGITIHLKAASQAASKHQARKSQTEGRDLSSATTRLRLGGGKREARLSDRSFLRGGYLAQTIRIETALEGRTERSLTRIGEDENKARKVEKTVQRDNQGNFEREPLFNTLVEDKRREPMGDQGRQSR